ncbi:MAG: DUF1553 domain-containing protein, partial [Planctomycetaceae bacterium]|nr:DUF1553 domain-containing protein [Planctomycetaceae bacterium]
KPLAGLSSLKTLVLNGTQVSDATLVEILAGMPGLNRLYLEDTAISDASLEAIARLTQLETLSLVNTRVSDVACEKLAGLAQLEVLRLPGTGVTDAGLPRLATLLRLRSLDLADTAVTGATLPELSGLPDLKHLVLSASKVTDSAVARLAELPALMQVLLFDCDISATDAAGLRTVLIERTKPNLRPYVAVGLSAAIDQQMRELLAGTGGQTEVLPGLPADGASAETAAAEVAAAGELLVPAAERYAQPLAGETAETPDFQRHVVPLLGRLGCNGRACHGSFQGKGGFRLSMFGFNFEFDHEQLTAGEEPRVRLEKPADSLILNKPTSDEEHGGGMRFERGGWEYHLLHRWISTGAKGHPGEADQLVRLEVTPANIVGSAPAVAPAAAGQPAASQENPAAEPPVQLQVVAVWADGTREDVTCLSRFQSNDDGIAEVSQSGNVSLTGASGDTHVIVFYDNGIFQVPVLKPVTDLTGDRYPAVPTPTEIDQLVTGKLSRLGIVPAEECTDEEFLRRVSLDLIGTLPTPAEVEAFLADDGPDRRTRKIEELLERPEYITWWTTRLCDLTGSNAGYLGGTEMAQPVAQQWRDWIERRVRDNIGYDEIVRDMVLATSRPAGQQYGEFTAQQSRFTARSGGDDFTAPGNPMPHYWYRSNQSAARDKVLTFGYTFLGVRLQCAECHKHPFDQWSQQDFQNFMQFFEPVKAGQPPESKEQHDQLATMLGVPEILNTAALRRQSYLRIAAEGRPIPWNEVYAAQAVDLSQPQPAQLLGGSKVDLRMYRDPREPLVDWLVSPRNPWFARSFVNRIWANYFNVGIIDPPDDLNKANPPSNAPLLDWLTEEFIAHGYDMKWLHREICRSRTYQLSWRPNETNAKDERNFSRAVIRRLPAEVLMDAAILATAGTAVQQAYAGNTKNRKIGQHPVSFQARAIDYSLLIFGKPLRTTNCDCERQSEPTLLQSLYLRNDPEFLRLATRSDSWIAELKKQEAAAAKADAATAETDDAMTRLATDCWLRVLSRHPSAAELEGATEHLAAAESLSSGVQDLLWALLNTQEFLTNH